MTRIRAVSIDQIHPLALRTDKTPNKYRPKKVFRIKYLKMKRAGLVFYRLACCLMYPLLDEN